MFNFKVLLRSLLGAIFIVLVGWVALSGAPEPDGQSTIAPVAQLADDPVIQLGVYEGLTVFADDEGDGPQEEGAKIVVKAQSTAEVGELVRFDVSTSRAESFKWILVPESVDFEVYNDGRSATFSARKDGEYMFIVACAYKSGVDVTTHIVTVGTPGPKPNSYPSVSRPDSKAKVGDWVPYWCSLTQRPQADARKLAESFDGIAATISAGVNTTPDEIIKATSEATRQALGEDLDAWKPFLLSLQNQFKDRAAAGTLVSADQHAKMWREVAVGLRAYANLFK